MPDVFETNFVVRGFPGRGEPAAGNRGTDVEVKLRKNAEGLGGSAGGFSERKAVESDAELHPRRRLGAGTVQWHFN